MLAGFPRAAGQVFIGGNKTLGAAGGRAGAGGGESLG